MTRRDLILERLDGLHTKVDSLVVEVSSLKEFRVEQRTANKVGKWFVGMIVTVVGIIVAIFQIPHTTK